MFHRPLLMLLLLTLALPGLALEAVEYTYDKEAAAYFYRPPSAPARGAYLLVAFAGSGAPGKSAIKPFVPAAKKNGWLLLGIAGGEGLEHDIVIPRYIARFKANPKILLSGFSVGTTPAMNYGWSNPDKIKALAVHCQTGMNRHLEIGYPYRPGAEKIPTYFGCGLKDPRSTEMALLLVRTHAYFQQHFRGEFYENVGHWISDQAIKDVVQLYEDAIAGTYRPPTDGFTIKAFKSTDHCSLTCQFACDRRFLFKGMNMLDGLMACRDGCNEKFDGKRLPPGQCVPPRGIMMECPPHFKRMTLEKCFGPW